MKLDMLTTADWQEFEDIYPDAARFLLHQSLVRELKYLASLRDRGLAMNHWQTERLAELKELKIA